MTMKNKLTLYGFLALLCFVQQVHGARNNNDNSEEGQPAYAKEDFNRRFKEMEDRLDKKVSDDLKELKKQNIRLEESVKNSESKRSKEIIVGIAVTGIIGLIGGIIAVNYTAEHTAKRTAIRTFKSIIKCLEYCKPIGYEENIEVIKEFQEIYR